MSTDSQEQILRDMLDAAKRGHFWIGSTSEGRRSVDRIPELEKILKLAIAGTVAMSRAMEK
jgi:hypothetical protein